MQKRIIKIRFQNGLNFEEFSREVNEFDHLSSLYQFDESENPDFIIFGPYGKDIPPKGRYQRIGYFCENIKPDLTTCEWAFGVPPEDTVKDPRYKQIKWHGVDPQKLVKPAGYDAEKIFKQKKYFCNFFYSHSVPYREEFFRQLSKYKKVDAPGKSMNNMPGIDDLYQGNKWERKRQFLSEYKFTIAFENYVYPGYQTEKLYDAMETDSLPIYCGNPLVGEIFNSKSFVNTPDYIKINDSRLVNILEKYSQPDLMDILPRYYNSPQLRIKRKLKAIGRELKMEYQFRKLDFSPLIDRIIELDKNEDKYIEVLQRPWFINNQPPAGSLLTDHWIKIFNTI